MTATLKFPNRNTAQMFATAWSRHSKRGYTLSKELQNKTAMVILDGVTEADKEWIEQAVQNINASIAK